MSSSILTNGVNDLHLHNNSATPSDRHSANYENVHFDQSLKPKAYAMKGTNPESKILFLDVRILDSTGAPPYKGDVLLEGERFKYVGFVPNLEHLKSDPRVRVIEGRGRTLMSGLGDAHTHLSWNSGDIAALGGLGIEEHTLLTARSAQIYLDSGYTMCFGAASAQHRLDVVVRDAINEGKLPGPRYLANCKETTRSSQSDVGQDGLACFADGPVEMAEVIRKHIALGADQVKITMSGEEVCAPRSSEICYFTDEETAVCVKEAHQRGVRVCAHARARDSVKMCVKHGVDVIFHASWADAEGMDMLEKNKSKHIVAPAINWLYASLYEAGDFGYKMGDAEKAGYEREFENARRVLKEMHERGITVLPGGDYGFAWTPHGTYARDLEHFVKFLDFTPMESILAATAGVAKLFMRENELGKIQSGYFADCILVDGDPLENIGILQDHDKLNVIIINGRIHKASHKEFLSKPSGFPQHSYVRALRPPLTSIPSSGKFTNYVRYSNENSQTRIGHLDLESHFITPLSMPSGASISSLYQVIELDSDLVPAGDAFHLDTVKVLPPIQDRDILAVGKNYIEHAKEFHASGYDSSDKVAKPSHPVIFTKRSTSIIGWNEHIYPHPKFTQTLDYEGEIGVIIGKAGFQIKEDDAMNHVWGYTIINDITARERQRDHKQFYIGKSADTFCPMGPIAVPATSLPKELRVQTFINGAKKQDATTNDLIFSVSKLVQTLSAGTTLQPGDIIATGTPAGVGFGQSPPTFLKPGDLVEVTVTGLGTLQNRVAEFSATSPVLERTSGVSSLPIYNACGAPGAAGLTMIGPKLTHVEMVGTGHSNMVFVHGLGGTTEFYAPLITTAGLKDQFKSYTYDLEGHGLSPTEASSITSIESYAEDLMALFAHPPFNLQSAVLIAHSMGALIALAFASHHPNLVKKLILLGPPPFPVPATASTNQANRAAAVRAGGMKACADGVATAGTSTKTKCERPVAFSAVRASLMSQHPEGYAKACMALGRSSDLEINFSKLIMPVLIVTGDEDKVSPLAACQKLAGRMKGARIEVLKEVGHWSVFEDPVAVANAVKSFL